MTDAAILDYISTLPQARANFKQLVRELGVKGGARTRLTARGDLIELRPGHDAVTAQPRIRRRTPRAFSVLGRR